MQKFFTFLIVLIFAFGQRTLAQVNTLKITDPVGIAGEYKIQRFNWGPIKTSPVKGVALFGDDGTDPKTDACTDLINDLTGKIGFVDRGVCGLVDKAIRAEKKGAIAVIICNTSTGTAANLIGGGAEAYKMKVSTYMMTNADCQKIRTQISAGNVNVELLSIEPTCDVTYEPEVFFGKVKGEGDFNKGLNSWIVETTDTLLKNKTSWFYSETGSANSAVAFSTNEINSKTKCNGAAAIDLFTLQSIDNPTLARPYRTYTSSIISPPINCEGKNSVVLQFSMLHNRLNGEALISYFDGTNWTEPSEISTANAVNTTATTETIVFPVPQFANKKNCRVKFIVSGDFYYFILDDVLLLNKKIVDIKVNKDFFSVSPSLRVPKDQVSEIPLLSDIENIGNESATGTSLKVEVRTGAGALLSTLTNNYGTVPGGVKVENKAFAQTYTPPATPGRYTGSYIISSPDESAGVSGNNKAEFEFYVTEKTFGNVWPESEIGVNYLEDIADSWVINDITNYYSAGNVYYVKNGKNSTVETVRFGLKNPKAEVDGKGYVYADLYELKTLEGLSVPSDRLLVGTGEVFIENIPNLRNISLPIFAPNAEGAPSEAKVTLKDNTNYFLAIHTSPLDPSVKRFQFLQYSGVDSDILDRSVFPFATNFAFDTLKINRICGSYWNRTGTSNEYSEIRNRSYSRTGNEELGAWAMLYLEMDVVQKSSTYDLAKTGEAKVFPNPANTELYVDLSLEKVSQNVRVDLVGIDGKTASSATFTHVQDARLRLDLSDVVSGAYNVLIHTDDGLLSRKVMVQR